MFKFFQKYLDSNLIKSSFVFAIIYCLLFNSAVTIYKFSYYQADILPAILELVKDFIYNLIVLFVFFFGLSVHRIAFIAGSLFLFITGAFASYYLFFFSVAPTAAMMPTIFGTHPTEVGELLSARIIVWVIFSVSICLYSIKYFNIQTTKSFLTRILSAVCLLIIVMNIISPRFSFLKTYFPMQYLHNSYVFFFGEGEEYAREDLSTKFSFVDSSDEDIIGVLVIGESARYSNFGVNGYKRETTPNLSKMDDLATFKARSCAGHTYLSVPCMLSRYGEQDMNLMHRETSILSVLTKLGFNTVLIGTQSITKYYRNRKGGSFYDEIDFHMIPGGSIVMQPNSHDEKILPYFEQNLTKGGKKFLVLHTTGSHWNYASRYPKEFQKFMPDIDTSLTKHDASSCDSEELVNSYDNSILYTDFFLSSVIELLKDKNAFLIYSSDHGESLGECGRLVHGYDGYAEEQREVPLMVWASEKYKNNHSTKWSSIQKSIDKDISHDYIFHSILDCLSIESDSIDKSLSLCHKGVN